MLLQLPDAALEKTVFVIEKLTTKTKELRMSQCLHRRSEKILKYLQILNREVKNKTYSNLQCCLCEGSCTVTNAWKTVIIHYLIVL